MIVLDIIEKIERIENVQRALKEISDRQQTSSSDEDWLRDAIDALEDYIQELMHKEVKESRICVKEGAS